MDRNGGGAAIAPIGVIGLGRMGAALAARLSGAGCRIHAWTRSGVGAAMADQHGIEAHAKLASLAAASEVMLFCLLDDAAVNAALDELLRDDLSGKLIVDTSTVSPDTLRGRLAEISASGATAIDAPISGGPESVAAGQAGLYVGGAEPDVARFRPVAALFADRFLHIGELGAGIAAKIVNNMMLTGFWQTLKEAVMVGKRSGLDLETMMAVLSKSPAANAVLRQRMPVIMGRDDTVGFSVAGTVKDLGIFTAAARKLGVDAPTMAAAHESFAACRNAGHGEEDLAAMVRAAYLAA